ncbi:DUF2577 family protein [Paenibacillus sp.]|uniref:DUF2577 family protein n=1 Tax=Paenibacillus sp. TaxID=58172 RepID=UPI002810FA4E|nr:DUF2577 family protein [Paenibacillus sp.]
MIKRHSIKSVQSLRLPELMEAEVVSGAPDLKIKLKGSDKLIIPKELIVVAEHLCRVHRKANLTNVGKTSISKQTFTADTDLVMQHQHSVSVDVELKERDFTAEQSEIHFLNEDSEDDLLKKGDKVMALSFEGGQKFFVLDRIVTY